MMKKKYIKPEAFCMQVANEHLLKNHSEPEGGGWVGGKTNCRTSPDRSQAP